MHLLFCNVESDLDPQQYMCYFYLKITIKDVDYKILKINTLRSHTACAKYFVCDVFSSKCVCYVSRAF